MKKKKYLAVFGIFTIILLMLIAIGMNQFIYEIYSDFPMLKYRILTSILLPFNVVPMIIAVFVVVKFALNTTKNNKDKSKSFKFNMIKTAQVLEKIFYFQSIYTFLSILIITILINENHITIVAFKYFIVFVSLTLALFFGVLKEGLSSNEEC